MAKTLIPFLLLLLAISPAAARAEDGYRLWLRYDPIEAPRRAAYARSATELVVEGRGSTLEAAKGELVRGLSGLLARPQPVAARVDRDGALVLAKLGSARADLGEEGYSIRSERVNGHAATVIGANSDRGLLYGAFAYLRLLQTRQPAVQLALADAPKLKLRLLDHWDNPDRSVERGYAGQSLWDWQKLPGWVEPRYTDYARADASIGINGVVLNNVNAKADVLTARWLLKVKALADTFRPWGIRVYLSARFSAPMELGGLKTADPLDPAVRAWWKAKAGEIYRLIPDFGGFLVKANSEGQPGPQDYRRSHAEGANMLAEALGPHGGTVFWRAFVYAAAPGSDRAKQAFEEFTPLDGRFAPNVVLQVKNGPIDFQPREPFHPLFGAMPRTPLALEAQITKEYLGFATHLAYLGTMWEEVLQSDTCRPRCGTPVARTIAAMAGVANVGTDRNWSGSQFDQANWYAFGRLAWNPDASAKTVAEEWARMTWTDADEAVRPIVDMMMGSRQAVVDYMTPLGLAHLMGTGHHYGPAPWVSDLERPDWNPTYYHRADVGGIGFDRTASGSNAVRQYAPEVAARFGNLAAVPDDYLLWFHHLPWDHRMRGGGTLWEALVRRYDRGTAAVAAERRTWDRLRPWIDPERHAEVAAFLRIQEDEAKWWRDASIAYFQSVSKRPLPAGSAPPAHDLLWYKSLQFNWVPGH